MSETNASAPAETVVSPKKVAFKDEATDLEDMT